MKSYKKYVDTMNADAVVQGYVETEAIGFVRTVKQLPFVGTSSTADVYYEQFILKLVAHMHTQLIRLPNERRLDFLCTKSTIWLIRVFRAMIEDAWGMNIFQRDEEGGSEQDETAGPIVKAFNACGVTHLCIDMIATGIDSDVQLEAVKLLVAMLFKEGGAVIVQKEVNDYLTSNDTSLFFQQLRGHIDGLIAWHKWQDVIVLEEGVDPSPPDIILNIRFMQLLAEGHYANNQEILREQPNNAQSFCLLDDLVKYLNCLSRITCRTSTNAAIRVASTILELIQGPCEGSNANHFIFLRSHVFCFLHLRYIDVNHAIL